MDLNKVQSEMDFGDESYKRTLQKKITKKLLEKPVIESVDDLLDWKMELWEYQYGIDYRMQSLCDNFLSTDEIENFIDTIICNPYIPNLPFFNQTLMLLTNGDLLYGGARGGGKSEAVLMGALQYVEFSEWSVGIFRLTYKDLTSAGAILNRAESWLYENPILKKAGIEPAYSKTKYTFTFPSGAEIQFAQIQYDDDAKHYQGAEFNEIYLDEAPQFSKVKLNRIKASVRKSIESPLPTGMKFTGNPGEVSTEYFRDKFVQGEGYFIDSKFIDNYYLDFEEYEERVFEDLKYEDPVLYAQWRNGDWNASNSGSMFRTDWFKFYTTINERITRRVRFWDLASTEKVDPTKGDDPDWTVGTLLFRGESGRLYLDNIVRFRGEPDEVEETIHEVAMQDGKDVSIFVEQEGGASGKAYVNYLQRVLQGYNFEGISARKDKVSRAKPVASSVKYGNLRLRDGEDWIPDFIAELTSFPTAKIHDDQVDSLSGAFAQITDLGDTPNNPNGMVNHAKFNYLNGLV